MSKELITKQFEAHRVRIVTKEDGQVWFVAKDVCGVLGLTHVTKSLNILEEDEKGCTFIPSLGGSQKMRIINESGLYTIIMRSNKPEARKFRKWVTSEVLPEIFRTGSYTCNTPTQEEPALSRKDYNKLLERVCEGLRNNISAGEIKRLRQYHGWTPVEVNRVLWNMEKNNRIMQCLQEIALENKRREVDSYNRAQLEGVAKGVL